MRRTRWFGSHAVEDYGEYEIYLDGRRTLYMSWAEACAEARWRQEQDERECGHSDTDVGIPTGLDLLILAAVAGLILWGLLALVPGAG